MKTKKGLMTKEKMGRTMPVDAPIWPELPILIWECEGISFVYETDEEAALAVLPDALDLELPATAQLTIYNAPGTTMGVCHEANIYLHAFLDGVPVLYNVYNLLDNDAAIAVGREIWGVPKKMGCVTLEHEKEGIRGTIERPLGTRLVTAMVRPESHIKGVAEAGIFPRMIVCLRVVPDPEGKQPLIQLIDHMNSESCAFRPGPEWEQYQMRGPGSVAFPTASDIDPWYRFKVVKMLDAVYSGGPATFQLPYGKILKTL